LAVARAANCQVLTASANDPLAINFIVGHGDGVVTIQTILKGELGMNGWIQVSHDGA